MLWQTVIWEASPVYVLSELRVMYFVENQYMQNSQLMGENSLEKVNRIQCHKSSAHSGDGLVSPGQV